jgi:hypothetical protein
MSAAAEGTSGSRNVTIRKASTAEAAAAAGEPAATRATAGAASTDPRPPGVGTAAARQVAAR